MEFNRIYNRQEFVNFLQNSFLPEDFMSSTTPNTPLAFRRRDECHLKQQAEHGKMSVGIGQDTEDYISHVADYDTCILRIIPQKNRSGL